MWTGGSFRVVLHAESSAFEEFYALNNAIIEADVCDLSGSKDGRER
jgi:hypothetical protein